MAATRGQTIPLSPDAEQVLARAGAGARADARAGRPAAATSSSSAVHSPIMSPLVWDLGHIAAYEDLWLAHRHGGARAAAPRARRASTTRSRPRARSAARSRRSAPPRRAPTCAAVRERTRRGARASGRRRRRDLRDGAAPRAPALRDDAPDDGDRRAAGRRRAAALRPAREAPGWIDDPGRQRSRWARREEGFAYDNERPRHAVDAGGLRDRRAARSATRAGCTSARAAATSGASGGRTRAGRGRRSSTSPTIRPWQTAHPEAPVCHVSWFEADAFARAHDARLPTRGRVGEGGDLDPGDRLARSAGVGHVWEWTASHFGGYPGFVRLPLPRVLGGLLRRATTACCGAARGRPTRAWRALTFRNWDLPQRRQIFAGVRLAREAMMEPRPQAAPRAASAIRIDSPPRRRRASARSPRTCSTASRARSRSCRRSTSTTRAARSCSTASASCPSTTRRAPSARSSRSAPSELARADRRASSWSSSARARPPRRACCSTRCSAAGTLERYVPVDVTESMVRDCAEELDRASTPGLRVHGVIGDFERHLDHVPPADRPAHRGVPRRHDRQLPARQPPALPARDRAPARPRGPPADGHRPGQGPARAARPPTTTPQGVTAEFNRNVLRVLNRELQADFDPEDFDHVALFDREHEWIEMRLRARREHTAARARARPDRALRRGRGAAHRDQREVHARARRGRPRRPPASSSCAG